MSNIAVEKIQAQKFALSCARRFHNIGRKHDNAYEVSPPAIPCRTLACGANLLTGNIWMAFSLQRAVLLFYFLFCIEHQRLSIAGLVWSTQTHAKDKEIACIPGFIFSDFHKQCIFTIFKPKRKIIKAWKH
jgi:hypothetical protein